MTRATGTRYDRAGMPAHDDAYASLPQSRVPLTDDDRRLLRNSATAARIGVLVIGGVAIAFGVVGVRKVIGGADGGDVVFGVFFTLVSLAVLAAAVWMVRRTSADLSLTEKVVYVAEITDKRTVRTTESRGPNQADAASTSYLLVLGFEGRAQFPVDAKVWAAHPVGSTVRIECLRPGEVWRVSAG